MVARPPSPGEACTDTTHQPSEAFNPDQYRQMPNSAGQQTMDVAHHRIDTRAIAPTRRATPMPTPSWTTYIEEFHRTRTAITEAALDHGRHGRH
jgi:hypothetical protein